MRPPYDRSFVRLHGRTIGCRRSGWESSRARHFRCVALAIGRSRPELLCQRHASCTGGAQVVITKTALPRRLFLRGVGATLALPLLDAMVPALTALAKTAAKPGRRIGFVYVPNGVAISTTANYWKPVGEGTAFEFSPILKPLEAYRDRMVVVSGLAHAQAEAMGDGQGDHSRAAAAWLSGVHAKQTEGADIRAARTLDQIAADDLGKETPLGSLELAVDPNFLVGNCENGYSCVYINTLSWRSATTPVPTENNPRVVFERMFGDGGTASQRLRQSRRSRSILDSVA